MADALAPTPDLELPDFKGTLLRPGDDGYDDARARVQRDDRPPPGADRALRKRRRRRRRGRPRA